MLFLCTFEPASCPLSIHADVFVLNVFLLMFGRFTRTFVSFVLETAWVVFTTYRDLSSPTELLLASRMVSSLVTCIIHIFAVCVAVCTVIERGVHHQNHDAVDGELFIGALVGHLAPRVVCNRKQSVIAGCRRLVGFVSEWLKRRRTSGASPLFELQNFVGVPNCYGRYCLWICHVADMVLISKAISFSHNFVA